MLARRDSDKSGVSPTPPRRGRRWRKIIAFTAATLILVLIAARVALPSYLKSYVNRALDQSPEYDGRVGGIDVHLWRGEYSIRDLKIVKTTNAVPVPFFESPRVDVALDWSALRHGGLRGRLIMHKPRLNFVHGPSPEETQTGENQPWLGIIDDLYPFRIDRAEIREGRVHFQAFHMRPQVDVFISELNASLENLTNVRDKLDPLMATVRATGIAMDSGKFEFDMTFDPHSHRPTFNLAARLLDLDVRTLNSLARAYGEFDFEAGRFDFAVELAAREGRVEGYAKPLFRGAQVISLRDIRQKDPLHAFWEAMVSVVGQVFTNQSRAQFGTRITIEGDLDNPRTNLLEIIGNVLYNAFVRAYLPRLEGQHAPAIIAPPPTERDQGPAERKP